MKNEKSNLKRMKYISLILILLTLFSYKKDNSFIVKGKVLNKESGIVRLNQIGEKAFDAKTCELTNGEFYFKGEVGLPEEFFIQYKENESSRGTDYFKFFVEPGTETEIIFDTEDFYKSEFNGSTIGNEYWKVSQTISNEFDSKIKKLIPDYQNAQNAEDKEQLNKIVGKLDSITNLTQNWVLDYVLAHTKSYISADLLYQRQFNIDVDTLQKYFDKLDKNLIESKYYKRLKSYLSVQVGKPFLDFELTDLNGNIHKLSSIAKDKVILIDFWASWCKPCREHNKHLKELYENNKSNGFEIVGVSQDRDTTQFLTAIQQDEMTWLNLLDKNDENAVSKKYETTSVPFNVLIDSNGEIAYLANDYENLEIMVNKLLNNK